MAIKQYTHGKLASERTSPVSADKSGQIIANSVAQVAGDLIQPIARMAQQQQQLLNESQRIKTMGEFSAEVLQGSEGIRQAHMQNPAKATQELQSYRDSVKDKYLSGVEDDQMRQELSIGFERFDADQKIHDVGWQIEQTGLITQQNYLDRINMDSKFLSSTTNYQDYLNRADNLIRDEKHYNQVFGLGKGDEVINKALESYTKGYTYNLIDQGKAFEAAQLLMGGKFDKFITDDVKRNLLEGVDKAQKGAVSRSEFLTAAEAVTDMFGASGELISGESSIAQLEDGISQTSYKLQQARENNASASNIKVLENQLAMRQKLRDASLAAIASTATDDMETKGQLMSQFNSLVRFNEKKHKNALTGTLVDLTKFQRDATEAYYNGKLSSDTYKKWMELSYSAISSDVEANLQQVKKGGFKDNLGWRTKAKISGGQDSPKIRKALTQILKGADNKNPQMAVDTMDFFLDSFSDKSAGGDIGLMKDISDQNISDMVSDAKMKARLKSMGYPVYLTVGNQINTAVGQFTISGRDADGMPTVDITKVNVGK